MVTTNLTVLRSEAPTRADVGPDGWAGAVVSVMGGKVTGEIIRSIYDGGTVEDEAHIVIDGHDAAVRAADVQTGDAQTLRDLSAVAAFLADELVTGLAGGSG